MITTLIACNQLSDPEEKECSSVFLYVAASSLVLVSAHHFLPGIANGRTKSLHQMTKITEDPHNLLHFLPTSIFDHYTGNGLKCQLV